LTTIKILAIDDDESILLYLTTKLAKKYTLVTTIDPTSAVLLATREQPDLILCDIDMPGMSGSAVSAALMACSDTKGIPFLFLSSLWAPGAFRTLGTEAGGRLAVAKGASLGELTRAIELALSSVDKP